MMEVEYKAPAADLEAVAARLTALGARPAASTTEHDTYYAHPMRAFAETDEALRIRATPKGRILTYKGRRRPGPTRSREEIEVPFDGDLDRILQALSFTVAGQVEKQRRIYRHADLTITLDQVHGLGDFVEVETLAPETELGAAREAVLALVARLGLGPEETRSYLELVLAQGTGSSTGGA